MVRLFQGKTMRTAPASSRLSRRTSSARAESGCCPTTCSMRSSEALTSRSTRLQETDYNPTISGRISRYFNDKHFMII